MLYSMVLCYQYHMTNKTVDVKRKIISLVKKRESKEALKIFHKNFTNENPADLEFIKNLFWIKTKS